ncbi:hypothetical protein HU230_0033895 [Bradyrhizobium quebecense]|uniref:Uncharacterized protein n=1 Tax=Bradyrhizobium quebecense TaxID=2748629 RepID=A0A973WUV8_9BRAD|nr:hypothetical protein [Bradyrhizobium quebecense]UGA43213.1 hypothetical protein HU230_0033895 [Bradyrhizobium quebecense]
MRKLILITAMVLASACAQAGERSLSLGAGQSLPAAVSNSVTTADRAPAAPAAPAVEPPPKPPEAPKYVERAAPVAAAAPAPQPPAQPTVQQAPVQQANVQPQAAPDARLAGEQRMTSHRSSHRRHARRWSESRIIGELHRHGIYW